MMNKQPRTKQVLTLEKLDRDSMIIRQNTITGRKLEEPETPLSDQSLSWQAPSQSQGQQQYRHGRKNTLNLNRNIFQHKKDISENTNIFPVSPSISRFESSMRSPSTDLKSSTTSIRSRKERCNSKFKNQVQIPQQKIWDIDIPCINCQQLIPFKEVDQHSIVCTKVNPKVKMVQKPSSIHRNLKVEQRCNALLQAVNRKIAQSQILKITDQSCLHAIEKYCKELMQIQQYEKASLVRCKTLWQDLIYIYGNDIQSSYREEPIQDFRGSPFVMIYLDRLRNLIRQKYEQISEALAEVNQKARSTLQIPAATYRESSTSDGAFSIEESGSEIATTRSPIERRELLHRLKQQRLRKIKNTIRQRQTAIEDVMKNSTVLPHGEKQLITEELKQGFDRTLHKSGDFRKLFEGGKSSRYEIISDVDSDLGKSSFRGYSTYSSASNFFTDESSVEENNLESTLIREPEESDKILEIEEFVKQEDIQRQNEVEKDQRILFAQTFAKMKQHFPSRHDAHKVPFDTLFEAAKIKKLAPKDWAQFILGELKVNSRQWMDASRIEKLHRQKNRGEIMLHEDLRRKVGAQMVTIQEQDDFSRNPTHSEDSFQNQH